MLRATWLGLVLSLAGGCTTNGRFSLDPLTNKREFAADPLRGGNALNKNESRLPGTARLMPPDTGGGTATALTSTPPVPMKPLEATGQSPSLGALAANTRARVDVPGKSDGSPFAPSHTAPVKQAQWSTAGDTGTAASFTWEQAKSQLRARGVTSYQLEQRDGQWTFRCSLPNPSNPALSRTLEASANDDLTAVRQVLESLR
jgi:hypothetical protein